MKKKIEDIKQFFKKDIVDKFDDIQKGLMPGYVLIISTMEEVIKQHFKDKDLSNGWILDVGAGTGNDSMKILDIVDNDNNYPFKKLKILAIDSSSEMKNLFVNKFKEKYPDKINDYEYITLDITSHDTKIKDVAKNKDIKIAISGYTLHHFQTDEKKKILQTMYNSLEPGGVLLNIDLFSYKSKNIRQTAHDFDIQYINDHIENKSIKTQWIDHYENKSNEDSQNVLDPVEIQIDILKEIGFVDVECVFRYWQQGVIRATKPTEKEEKQEKHPLYFLEKSLKIKNEIIDCGLQLQNCKEVNQNFKNDLKEKLGIIAIGVSILSKADEDVRFLIDSDVHKLNILNKRINNKHNFSISHKHFSGYDDFINLLYFIGRGSTIKYPEYLLKMKEYVNPFENEFQKEIREKYQTLHISAGEILLFTLVWRYLIGFIKNKPDLDLKICNLSVPRIDHQQDIPEHPQWTTNPFTKDNSEFYLIESIKKIEKQNSHDKTEENILKSWKSFMHILKNNYEGIEEEFGLNCGNRDKNKEAIEEYVRFLFNNNDLNIGNNLNGFIEKILPEFGEIIGLKPDDQSIKNFLIKLHASSRVPIMPFYFLMLGDKEKVLKEQIVFPLLHTFSKESTMYPYLDASGKRQFESAVIHTMWVVKPINEISNTKEQPWYGSEFSFISYIKELHDLSQSICSPIMDEYFEKEHRKKTDAIKIHATRAAVSQVMARNMSHNIGSHVLSKMVSTQAAQEMFPFNEQYESSFQYIYKNLKPNDTDDKVFLLANFISYLRTRMDFLADIATGTPSMETTCFLIKDIMGELDKNRILLNLISGVQEFPYKIKVKDSRNCNEQNVNNESMFCTGEDSKDIPVSIPNGIMGYHALYVIIENIIRNSAKHQSGQNLNREFILEIKNSQFDETLYEVLVYDNTSIIESKVFRDEDKELFKAITGKDYDNTLNNKLDWLVFNLNHRINSSVINKDTNKLRDGAWGMIEMDASAAYLRKMAAEKIDDEIYDIDLLKPNSRFAQDNPDNKELNILKAVNIDGHLGYRFHLMKPKELLVVDETGEIYKTLKNKIVGDKTKLAILRENGIWVLHTDETINEDLFDIEKIYAHPFLLIITGNNRFDVNKYLYLNGDINELFRGNLPFRIIVSKKMSNNSKENSSPWVTYIEDDHQLIENLKNADKLVREQINSSEDIYKNTLMDLVWSVWLKNRTNHQGVKDIIGIKKTELETKEETPFDAINTIQSITENETTQNNNKKIVVYKANHGEQKEYNDFKKESDFLLFFPSSVKNFIDEATMIKSQGRANQKFDKYKTAKLVESVLNKVLIIDERVQASWETNYSNFSITKREVFKHCGFFSPDASSINFNDPVFTDQHKESINRLIIDIIQNSGKIKGLDYIVIHLGIIEKILTFAGKSKNKEDVKSFIKDLQNTIPSKTRIVITSGRGKPDNLPEDVPYISFSTLSQYAIETPFKPFLSQIIQNARINKHQ